jgi:predicted transposase/invertase (TIGR01784 family)
LVSEQLGSGDKYGKLSPVISIVICNHILLPEEEGYINRYQLRNEHSGNVFTDLEQIVILEVPKLSEDDRGKLWLWMKFFQGGSEEELDMLGKKDKGLERAVGVLKELSWSERHRERAAAREKWRMDQGSWKIEKYEEGLAAGMEKSRLEIAQKMKADGLSIEQIQLYTGLSAEEIEKTAEKLEEN